MPIRGIAFDLEGTVVDVEAAHHGAHLAAAAEFGLTLTFEEALIRIPNFIGGPDVCKGIWGLLDPEIQERTTVSQIIERDSFHYEQFLATMEIAPRPGFIQALFIIKNLLGLEVAIGSLTQRSRAAVLLDRSGLNQLFGGRIVLYEDVARRKPAPDVFIKTAEIMGILPQNQLVFDDSPQGIRAAIAAGSKAVGMPVIIRPHTVAALIEAGACRIFYDWREINILALIENVNRMAPCGNS